jgi:phage tail tube protein FII
MLILLIPCFAEIKNFEEVFACEGNNPIISNNKLKFSALGSKYLSPNGHGWRNELKRKIKLRTDMYKTEESLSAIVTFWLSNGAKTIFSQYHEANTSTLLLVFIGDIKDKILINGIPNDGIFDIYCVYINEHGKRQEISMGEAKSGGSFRFKINNNCGNIILTVNDKSVSFKTKNSKKVYFKFGDYIQAQDPVTSKQADSNKFSEFYTKHGISEDIIEFSEI